MGYYCRRDAWQVSE